MRKLLLLLIALLFLPLGYSATVLFEQTFTPTYLYNNSLFPTRTPTLASGGTSITFNTGSAFDKLMQLNLLAANTLSSTYKSYIHIQVNADALTSDNDLGVMISDGTSAVGFLRADNTSGTGYLWEANNANQMSTYDYQILYSNAGFPQTFSTTIELGTQTLVTGTMNTSTATGTAIRTLNRTSALNLVLLANDTTEIYRINSIYVQVTTDAPIPEPNTILLLSVVFGCLILQKIRK